MLDLSPDKILMLAVVALVVLGPNRLPQAARSFGRFIGQMKSMSSTLQTEVRDAIGEEPTAAFASLAELHPANVRRTVRKAVTETVSPFSFAAGEVTVAESTPPGLGASSSSPASGAEFSGPQTGGWAGAPTPDDPGLN